MSCGEYNLPIYAGDFVAEDNRERWIIEARSITTSARKASLEDEIRMLRSRMEKIFLEEQSFTSDIVVEISTLLDLKINEYMRAKYKQ
ncbi:aspartyl-phosphate phosphatase Spo0E family protein [Paenibacillus caui]|uniref:aspartyl-phosphate phosphatase Spo0E family protein n=1 Tax=Paenibacillus caui TaxID=2873927 RepID=UPI001CA99B0B|nr:aspartyl-phosphate phosphatase Spo0E family protein [Paenibacillus caui]